MNNIAFFNCDDYRFEIVKKIRTDVFTLEQGADKDAEFDEFDNENSNVCYALLYNGGEPVATARLVSDDTYFKIGRIAVLKSYRGRGFGDKIVRAMLERAFSNGASQVLVDAQNYAVPFYEKIGFKIIGKEIIDRGLPHIPMALSKSDIKNNKH
ncbi:MAG: GNAT family N-acetyltransferase [Clostridiales bacterium]|nr:GNAT family N-acetyltransferase [Clostridiales bacterium]